MNGERHLFFALTNAAPGREADFNAWYDAYHVREVVEHAPGFVSGRRYRLNPQQRVGAGAGDPPPWQYLAVYEIESDDLAATHRALSAFSHDVGFTGHDGALADGDAAWVYSPLGPRLDGGVALGDDEHLFLAFTNPSPGREEDFDRWYERHHLSEILAEMPGFTTARRYEARPERQRPGQAPPWRHLALYDLRGDVAAIHAGDERARASGRLTPNGGVFDASFAVWVFTPVGPRVGAGVEAAA